MELPWSVVPVEPGLLFECARWIPEEGVFQWVDILAPSIHRWRPGDDAVESRQLDLEFATMALPLDGDRSLVASRSSLHEYHWASGALRTLGSWSFDPDVRFNDGGIAPDGTVYLGTMSMDRRPDAGSLFRWESDRLEPVVRHVGISNGIGWASLTDGYYVDSLVPRINRLDVTSTVPLATFVDLDAADEPDGLSVLPGDGVLVAMWGGARLSYFSKDRRRVDIKTPAQYPTSLAVSTAPANVLLVTTANIQTGGTSREFEGRVLWTDADWREFSMDF